jgi:hypothetical protein
MSKVSERTCPDNDVALTSLRVTHKITRAIVVTNPADLDRWCSKKTYTVQVSLLFKCITVHLLFAYKDVCDLSVLFDNRGPVVMTVELGAPRVQLLFCFPRQCCHE